MDNSLVMYMKGCLRKIPTLGFNNREPYTEKVKAEAFADTYKTFRAIKHKNQMNKLIKN